MWYRHTKNPISLINFLHVSQKGSPLSPYWRLSLPPFKDKLSCFDGCGNSLDRQTFYWPKFDHSCLGCRGERGTEREMCHFSVGGWAYFSYRTLQTFVVVQNFCLQPPPTLFTCWSLCTLMSSQSAHTGRDTLSHTHTINTHLIIVGNRYDGTLWGDAR